MNAPRRNVRLFLLMVMLATAGCSGQSTEAPTPTLGPQRPSPTPPPTATPVVPPEEASGNMEEVSGVVLPRAQNELFATSGICADCHTGMVDTSGSDVSIDTDWRVSAMANASLDPFWQAAAAYLHEQHPEQEAFIEETCSRCHVPMSSTTAALRDESVELIGEGGILDPESLMEPFALDGISCSVCHQIRADNLGFQTSYTGNYYIDTELRPPFRLIFGPYSITDTLAAVMQDASGFRPEQGIHLGQSEACATCHTVYAEYLDGFGNPAGTFPQQTTYLEWYYSDYSSYAGCVDCHMEDVDGGVHIAEQSTTLRSPFEAHTFSGGNAFLLQVLSVFGGEEALAAVNQLQEAATLLEAGLQEDTASVSLSDVRVISGNLYADILVENAAGHKLPTGFPSRRVWLHITVSDGSGAVVFESGGFRPDGSIIGNSSDEEDGSYEPHYLAIVQPDQVQIYETILLSTENDLTTDLLYAARYVKDNRLLPPGYAKDSPYEDLAVHGRATEDEDFDSGSDLVELIAALGDSEGPYTLRVELLYQSVGYSWLRDFIPAESPAVLRFLAAVEQTANVPLLLAFDEVQLEP